MGKPYTYDRGRAAGGGGPAYGGGYNKVPLDAELIECIAQVTKEQPYRAFGDLLTDMLEATPEGGTINPTEYARQNGLLDTTGEMLERVIKKIARDRKFHHLIVFDKGKRQYTRASEQTRSVQKARRASTRILYWPAAVPTNVTPVKDDVRDIVRVLHTGKEIRYGLLPELRDGTYYKEYELLGTHDILMALVGYCACNRDTSILFFVPAIVAALTRLVAAVAPLGDPRDQHIQLMSSDRGSLAHVLIQMCVNDALTANLTRLMDILNPFAINEAYGSKTLIQWAYEHNCRHNMAALMGHTPKLTGPATQSITPGTRRADGYFRQLEQAYILVVPPTMDDAELQKYNTSDRRKQIVNQVFKAWHKSSRDGSLHLTSDYPEA
jgi:hypothetical protein